MPVGIIYALESGTARRVVIADDQESLDLHVDVGEALLLSDDSIFLHAEDGTKLPCLDAVNAAIAAAIGHG